MTNEPKKARSKRKPAQSENSAKPAYFLSLEVENVLCFKDRQRLDLSDGNGNPARWTVILGDNGVGKTTLLRCLALIPSNQYQISNSLEFICPSEKLSTIQENFTKLSYQVAYHSDSSSSRSIQIFDEQKVEPLQKIEGLIRLSSFGWVYSSKPLDSEKLRDLTRYGYGATRRIGKSLLSSSSVDSGSESLFSEEAPLINAEEWLLQTDYAARSASGKTRDRLQKQLTQIFEILKRILPDVEDIRIAPASEELPRPRAEFLTPYGWVDLSGLGLGYRTTIAWMVDLAVRLFRRYPESEDPLAEPAIVLVDEIDLHLHPKWQRTIMSFLTERFPNTQFIVTAHSPLVVQAAKDANLVLLRREGDRVVIDNDPEIIENWRVDQILTSIFELPSARSATLDPLLARRQELLTKARLTDADKAELKDLETQIGSLPTGETPEDIRAMDIIRRAAKLLENS